MLLPLWTFHPQLTATLGCPRHRSWPDTVLYTFTNNKQVLLVSRSPSETKTSCCHNLRTILSSTILPVLSFTRVSAAKPLISAHTWLASCPQGAWWRGGGYHGNRLLLTYSYTHVSNLSSDLPRSTLSATLHSRRRPWVPELANSVNSVHHRVDDQTVIFPT